MWLVCDCSTVGSSFLKIRRRLRSSRSLLTPIIILYFRHAGICHWVIMTIKVMWMDSCQSMWPIHAGIYRTVTIRSTILSIRTTTPLSSCWIPIRNIHHTTTTNICECECESVSVSVSVSVCGSGVYASVAESPREAANVAAADPWSVQMAWFRSVMAASKNTWKIVIGHHTIYTSTQDKNFAILQRDVSPILEQYGNQRIHHAATPPLSLS